MNLLPEARLIRFSNQMNCKYLFVKRSVLSTLGKDKEFKFNFPATTEQLIENLNLNDTNETKETSQVTNETKERLQHTNFVTYSATDNSFRFNFDIKEEIQQ